MYFWAFEIEETAATRIRPAKKRHPNRSKASKEYLYNLENKLRSPKETLNVNAQASAFGQEPTLRTEANLPLRLRVQ